MPTLLIADDNAVDRELARRSVAEIEGLAILEVADGEEALAAIAESAPDLVLTDLRMPGIDGLELVRQVQARFPVVPVILMTSRGSEQIAVEALSAGAVSYVPKGELPEALAETVEQALGIAAARRDREQVLRYLEAAESRFELDNDPELISPLVAYLQDDLARLGFADDQVRSQIGTALLEAISNAMIHGNLEVSSELRANGTERYHALIAERRAREPWASRRVHVVAERLPGRVAYRIRDEGPGFDIHELPDPTRPESMLKARGRGLFLIQAFMDEVEHNESGNEIRLTKSA